MAAGPAARTVPSAVPERGRETEVHQMAIRSATGSRVAGALALLVLASTAGLREPPSALAATGSSATLAPAAALSLDPPPRPNIVVILLDDVPPLDGRLWEALPVIRTRIVRRAVEFADFHGETPVCCPGRAGFLTGLHTHHHGVVRNDGRLFHPQMTIATQLRAAGYHTLHVGKYLNRFDAVADKRPPGWSEFHGSGGGYHGYLMWSQGRARYHGYEGSDYSTDVIARLAARGIRRAPSGRPLMAWIAPFSTHLPITPAPRHARDQRCSHVERWAPPGYMERDVRDKPAFVRNKPIRMRAGFPLGAVCRTLLSVDQLVGRVLRALQDTGRLDDTLVILTSDNGMSYGAHRLLGDKKSPSATQLPFFAVWPNALGNRPRTVRERVQNIDLAPTLCRLAGCRLGPYPGGYRRPDGRSFASLLLGTATSLNRDAVLSSYRDPGRHVPRWFGIDTTGASPLASQGCAAATDGGCRWSYVEYSTGEQELYDLSNGPCWEWSPGDAGDPCRLRSLHDDPDHVALKRALRTRLRELVGN
jgi:N-acetylglucosamine-6-sulfatase